MPDPSATSQPRRLNSLDQFRGYTVLGMFVVNFVGSFAVIRQYLPVLRHHHTYCSYADTIMPQFFFAVGFAYRLTFLRRAEREGFGCAYWQATKRCLGLLVVALFVHRLDGHYLTWADLQARGFWGVLQTAFQREYFQTLTHIAVTSLWIMPVIAARPSVRVIYAVGSAVLFFLLSQWWYYDWVMTRPGIDGGPLGFLTWTIPTIAGTLAYDLMAPLLARGPGPASSSSGAAIDMTRPPVGKLLAAGAVLMLLGYGLSCLNRVTPPNRATTDAASAATTTAAAPPGVLVEPPFVPPTRPVNIWTMSQRAGSVTYLTFGAGFSLAVYALFVAACDFGPFQVGIFRTLGTNALAGYILHDLVNAAIEPFVPRDSPMWYVTAALGVSIGICYVILRYLEKHRIFLRL
jgi:predicted acyltransferase